MLRRVAIGMISHESSTYSPVPTPLDAFRQRRLLEGEAILDAVTGTGHHLAGFLTVAQREGWEVLPTISAQAEPSAPLDAQAYAYLKGRLLTGIQQALEKGRVDGVLLAMHGAMLADGYDDPEADIVQAVRELLGPQVPIILQLDLHGNIGGDMVETCDGVFAYDTNPHVDGYHRCLEAAECLAAVFAGTVQPVNAIVRAPLLLPSINMRTDEGPMVRLLERAREWERRREIINVSVFGGFAWADVPDAGFNCVVTADGDRSIARQAAADVAALAWELRQEFLKPISGVRDAVDRALALDATYNDWPVILADVSDNPGGGGSGDTTMLLQELMQRRVQGVAAAAIWDPETVRRARAIGVGAEAEFAIGGRHNPDWGAPLRTLGRVRTLSDGRFVACGPFEGRLPMDLGPTARIDLGGEDGLSLVVTSHRIACNDDGIFRVVGIQPEAMRMLVLKSRGHFRAAFEPLAREIIEVDAPGPVSQDLAAFPRNRVRRPIWPLDFDMQWQPKP